MVSNLIFLGFEMNLLCGPASDPGHRLEGWGGGQGQVAAAMTGPGLTFTYTFFINLQLYAQFAFPIHIVFLNADIFAQECGGS